MPTTPQAGRRPSPSSSAAAATTAIATADKRAAGGVAGLRGLHRWLCVSGIIAPACAAGGVAAISQLTVGHIALPLVCVVWLVVYASYLIDSVSEVGEAAQALASTRTRYLRRRRHRSMGLGLLAFAAACAWSAVEAGWVAAGLLLFPLSVVLYCLPVLQHVPGLPATVRCIKDIPFAKAFYTAFFWGLLGVFAVFFIGRGSDPAAVLAGFVLLAVRAILNTTFCDLKDVERDRAAGIRTFAVALGRVRLLQALTVLNLALPVALCAAVWAGALPPAALGLCLTALYYQAMVGAARRQAVRLESLCNVVADAEWVFWPLYLAAAGAALA